MYNFTLTANNEAELKDTFDSFKSAVNTELKILGLGTTSSKRNEREEGETANLSPDLDEKKEESVRFIDSQRPGLHISTILRQIMFDVLYGVEFVVLLAFGFSSNVKVCTF